MKKGLLIAALLLGTGLVSAAQAQDQIRLAVMEFASKGGVDQGQMDALSDMLANEIRGLGNYRVVAKADIRAALQMEEQKVLLGCDNASCLAEIGGALGVRFVVTGNISLFGKTYLMNLKLMNVENVTVVNSISRTVKGEPDQLIELLPKAAADLFRGARHVLWPDGVKPPPLKLPGSRPPAVQASGGTNEWGAADPATKPPVVKAPGAKPPVQPEATPPDEPKAVPVKNPH